MTGVQTCALPISVADRGVPNRERIAIFVEETTNMGQYGVMVGHSAVDRTAIPYQDNLFWFGDGIVNKGDWILLYTGKGKIGRASCRERV